MAASVVPSTPRKRGTSTTITLASGGMITLTVVVDLTKLSKDDRTYVFELIDQMNAYQPRTAPEAKAPKSSGEKSSAKDAGPELAS
jgi:hypothetical protein